jgi:hypothetical protein
MSRRIVIAVALGLAAIALLVGVDRSSGPSAHGKPTPGATALAGSDAKFSFLAAQNSNSCSLDAKQVRSDPSQMRLQGSCCSAMDRASYKGQVNGLREFAALPQIPVDPYDVSVGLAKRLLNYDRNLHLNPARKSIYKRAMSMTSEGAPCCCFCWRWIAFRGLSKLLIVRKHWPAPKLARLISLLDGCGGAQPSAAAT